MPLSQPTDPIFGPSWDRLQQGAAQLDPHYQQYLDFIKGRRPPPPGTPLTVSIPPWHSVIHLGARPRPGPDDWKEYGLAIKQGRPPNLPPEMLDAIKDRIIGLEAQKTSPTPSFLAGWTQILTALDNVQDFLSTVATIGRLILWAAPKIAPRIVPGVGWVVLAADIVNLMSAIAMIAMPAYAALCAGPTAAIAAGLPAVFFKGLLKQEAWTMANLNPFSRYGKFRKRPKVIGRLPSVSNLVEVAQTTDQLFGVGLSLGSLYGMVVEGLSAAELSARGQPVRINPQPFLHGFGAGIAPAIQRKNTAEVEVINQAARVMAQAPAIAGQADVFPEWIHHEHLGAILGAVGVLATALEGVDHDELFGRELIGEVRPPGVLTPHLEAEIAVTGVDPSTIEHWWFGAGARSVPIDEYAGTVARMVPAALRALWPSQQRRIEGQWIGACVNEVTEQLFHLFTGDPYSVAWELTPQWRLIVSMTEAGLLAHPGDALVAVQRFLDAGTAALTDTGRGRLEEPELLALARAAGITLFRLLPPESPLPAEWLPYFEYLRGSSR